MQCIIVFSSPAGSTRRAAEMIAAATHENQLETKIWDLAKIDSQNDFQKVIGEFRSDTWLFIGSPVYRDMAVPPVMRFIKSLPAKCKAMAVPFVTWGKACSGIALWQMAGALRKKKVNVCGALKILGVHSMMWRSEKPPGKGHPDKEDDVLIKEFVEELIKRFHKGKLVDISLESLDYQDFFRADKMKTRLTAKWMTVPKKIDEKQCNQCGICETECPAGGILLKPYPEYNEQCFDCFNCVRLCPENAIKPAFPIHQIEKHILERIEAVDEQPLSQAFL
ncbi:EFR1 family ferrodoxin [Desulfobacterales bacterium HSG17]|nr:EFR1 family ferrodoxin [Desulfobacterales bacterium HSG17]